MILFPREDLNVGCHHHVRLKFCVERKDPKDDMICFIVGLSRSFLRLL